MSLTGDRAQDMKKSIRQLTATLSAISLFAVCADVRADSKQECAAAYEKTQALRDEAKLIDARIQAVACSSSTCSDYVITDCARWLTELDAILPTVVFTAVDGAGAETTAVRVTVDGQVVSEKLDGKAVPMDPGEHTVLFESAGAAVIQQKVLIRQGEKNRLLAASFKKAPPEGPVGPAGSSWNGYRIGAIAAGVVGLAGIGVGAAFGVTASSQWDEARADCQDKDPNKPCGTKGIALGKEAFTSATFSTTGFVVGGVGLAAGALLLILAPKSGPAAKGKTGLRVTPVIGQHGLGTIVEGSF